MPGGFDAQDERSDEEIAGCEAAGYEGCACCPCCGCSLNPPEDDDD